MISELTLCGHLVSVLRRDLPNFVVIKHHDPITTGVPDISVTGRKKTTWLEVKYANPRIIERAAQAALVRRLAVAGSAYYVVYRSSGILDIIYPHPDKTVLLMTVASHDHQVVVKFIKELHT